MSIFAVYLDIAGFQATAPSIETNSLLGGNTTLTAPASQGALSLTVGSITGVTSGQTVYILDGANSEEVTCTGAPSGSAIPCTATLAAHGIGVCVTTAGSQGALAEAIIAASREVENICQQWFDGATDVDADSSTLFAVSRTETYQTPYGGAQVDIDRNLVVTPCHFPVRSVASVTIQFGASTPLGVTLTNLVLPNGGRQIKIPQAQTAVAVAPPYFPYSWWPRDVTGFVTVTYTGGPCNGTSLAAVPIDIKHATALLTQDRLAFRANPLGVAMQRLGDTMQNFELRGDFGGKSLLWKDAANRLRRYVRKTW